MDIQLIAIAKKIKIASKESINTDFLDQYMLDNYNTIEYKITTMGYNTSGYYYLVVEFGDTM